MGKNAPAKRGGLFAQELYVGIKIKLMTEEQEQNKRYLKKFEIVETEVELPIQGQVRDPEDLYKFLKDLENENVSKVIGFTLMVIIYS